MCTTNDGQQSNPDQPNPDQPAPDDAPQRPTPDDSFVAYGTPADGALVTNDDLGADSDPWTEGVAGGDIGSAADAAAETDTPAGDTSTTGKAGAGARSGDLGGRVGVELRVGLSTLLGHDRHPGDIPGWGTVTAETARALAAAQHRAEWRYALTDQEGRLVLGGITRRRPRAPEGNGRGSGPGVGLPATGQEREPIRGGIVELHIPSTLLAELAAHPETCGPWASMIDDIATQYHASVTNAPDGAGGTGGQDPSARFAGAVLRRHIQIRDRTCVYPGCRCSARHADLDHTVDHGHGGATTEANSGPLCRHDHRLKHEGGWRLRQPEPGHFVWISPLSRSTTPGPNRSPPIYPTRCPGRSTPTPHLRPPTTSTDPSSTGPHPHQTRHPHRHPCLPVTRTNPRPSERPGGCRSKIPAFYACARPCARFRKSATAGTLACGFIWWQRP